jgi:hypothetical protein
MRAQMYLGIGRGHVRDTFDGRWICVPASNDSAALSYARGSITKLQRIGRWWSELYAKGREAELFGQCNVTTLEDS